jgi:hypothetical protein
MTTENLKEFVREVLDDSVAASKKPYFRCLCPPYDVIQVDFDPTRYLIECACGGWIPLKDYVDGQKENQDDDATF